VHLHLALLQYQAIPFHLMSLQAHLHQSGPVETIETLHRLVSPEQISMEMFLSYYFFFFPYSLALSS
jgi:hypothetical protein